MNSAPSITHEAKMVKQNPTVHDLKVFVANLPVEAKVTFHKTADDFRETGVTTITARWVTR